MSKSMSIGKTIKKLRRERDITQEQLAAYLGITSRAVSQWECDRTAPDITQLPLLSAIFDTTTDAILGLTCKGTRNGSNGSSRKRPPFRAAGTSPPRPVFWRTG